MDIATAEIVDVEMLTVMLARQLEGAPGETTEKAAAANAVLAAVLGGQNPQHAIVSGGNAMPTTSQGVPWNTGYIVASGNLLTDFRSNAAAEGQSRLMSSRIANMTDDRGVKEMLAFNLARDTYHQQQWLLGIQQLQEDGFTDGVIEHSNGEWENKDAAHVFYTSTPGSRAGEGLWATSNSLVDGEPFRTEPLEPLHRRHGACLPLREPKRYVTYDGSQGPRQARRRARRLRAGRAERRRQAQGRADGGLLTVERWAGHTDVMADDTTLAALGERLVAQVVEFGIRGVGPLSTAVETAEEHLITAGGDREEAIRRLVATHVRLAAVSGFVTGLGGIVDAAGHGAGRHGRHVHHRDAHVRRHRPPPRVRHRDRRGAQRDPRRPAGQRRYGGAAQHGRPDRPAVDRRRAGAPARPARSPRSTGGSATSWSRRRGRRASST